ncbi:TPA_asm: M [Rubus alphacytorhabdovirus 1]|nr:TPA_asm: M [Rubus alphacytorhabdovirus 1]
MNFYHLSFEESDWYADLINGAASHSPISSKMASEIIKGSIEKSFKTQVPNLAAILIKMHEKGHIQYLNTKSDTLISGPNGKRCTVLPMLRALIPSGLKLEVGSHQIKSILGLEMSDRQFLIHIKVRIVCTLLSEDEASALGSHYPRLMIGYMDGNNISSLVIQRAKKLLLEGTASDVEKTSVPADK